MLHAVNPGDLIRWDGEEYIIAAARANQLRLAPVRGGSSVWVDVPSVAGESDFVVVRDLPDGEDQVERFFLSTLTPEEHKEVLWWRDHLYEVELGVVDPSDTDAKPRPGYDDPRLTVRRKLKAQELTAAGFPVTTRTLLRKWQSYQAQGLEGLLDKRGDRKTSVPRVPAEVERAVLDVLSATTDKSTVTTKVLIAQVKVLVERQHPDADIKWPSDSTLRRLIDAYDPRGRARGAATTRRTEANRPDRQFKPVAAYYPGQYVEADSSPFNFPVRNPDGSVTRSVLHGMIDLATRTIVSWHITPESSNGYDLSLMVARALRPRVLRETMPAHTRMSESPFLPHHQLAGIDEAFADSLAVPFIVPECITTDQGKDYRSVNFVETCRMFGISIIPAPPGSPADKPTVERVMRTIETQFMQYIEGYLGNAVVNRGRKLSEDPLTLNEVDDLFAEFVTIYQNTPHSKLRDRREPKRSLTPNQMYAQLFDATGGVSVPLDERTYIGLMPSTERVVQSDGIHFNRDIYDSGLLNELRGRRGKVEVRYDPYDSDRVWVRHPETEEWLECRNTSLRREEVPFGADRPSPPVGDVVFTHDDFVHRQLHSRAAKEEASRKTQRAAKKTTGGSRSKKEAAVKTGRDDDLRPAASQPPAPTPGPAPTREADPFTGGFDPLEAWNA